MEHTLECDLLVIGAGPAGLFAAYYAGFRDLRVVVVDSLPEPGGQVSALYPEKVIYDVAGFPAVKGQELVDRLVEQAAQYSPRYLLGHRAEHLAAHQDHVEVITSQDAVIQAKAVLITGGIGTFTPRPLQDAEDYEGHGLRYFVPKLEDLRDQDVLIVGGGDSAFDWADSLDGVARSRTLIHRREQFRAHEGTVQKVLAGDLTVLTPYEVAKISGDPEITAVDVFHSKTGERRTLEVQAVVAALGFTADMGIFASWGIEQRKRHLLVDAAMRTNLPRVFAAGDIVDYASDPEAKVRLIAVGFGEAATAVNNAVPVIRPGAKVFPGHSSDPG
ncbi:NAD(P)/FAD-dependent oxidoreductase [Cumulibacter manganitolerans]|uniref:NAD(P)/FAD-dependent oxidoreductase n=1 Tax=Cumulibacter manganitolerans TaxID=1884992 RepID=UPI001297E79C|nr:NAD(P)/FAD-dependent oxidoreductase [Cumulibacter manganitolerans]